MAARNGEAGIAPHIYSYIEVNLSVGSRGQLFWPLLGTANVQENTLWFTKLCEVKCKCDASGLWVTKTNKM